MARIAVRVGPQEACPIPRAPQASVDKSYTAVWAKMTPEYYIRRMADEGMPTPPARVFVATDELDRGWCAARRSHADLAIVHRWA